MKKVAIIGLGNIGSSICRALKAKGMYTVYGYDSNPHHRTQAEHIGFCHKIFDILCDMVSVADIVILATPISTYGDIVQSVASCIQSGAILSDVGSVKTSVIESVVPHVPHGVHFVPFHPIAGTEKSGPYAGFAELFQNRYAIVCPLDDNTSAYQQAVASIISMWEHMGASVEIMHASYHDKTLAMVSHIPHLLGFTLVGSARHLEDIAQSEVIKYSAGGFRDATRVAGSDPTMWRDIFLANHHSVRDMLKVFKRDLEILETAMENADGDTLYNWFCKTHEIRQEVIDAGQAEQYDPLESLPPLNPYNTD